MFEGLLVFLQNSWEQFHALKAIEQLSAVFTICVPLGGMLYAYSQRITQKLRQKTEELQILQELSENRSQQIKTLQQALKKSDETIAALKFQRPESLLKQAAAERENGNEERAIRLLRTGFESIREPLSACCLDLAAHHFSLVPDYGGRHGGEAERQARLATLLCPADENSRGLLAEILAVKAESDYTSGNEQGYDTAWDEVDDFLAIGKHPEIVGTLENQAVQYYHQGHYRLAERLFRRLVTMCRRQFGDDSPVTLRMRNQLALSLGVAGHYGKALLLFQALLPDMVRGLGKDHHYTLITRGNLALFTGQMGDAAGALALSQALLPDRERVLGKDHPDTLATRTNIATWTGNTGDAAGALALSKALLPDRERMLGKDHPDTLNTRHNIAGFTGKAGDAAGALALLKTLLPDRERVLGKEHPDTLTTRNDIAGWTVETGDGAEGLALSQALLPDLERVLGKEHPDTLTPRHNIAAWTAATGDVAGALALCQTVLADQERVLGKDHPHTLTTRSNIAFRTAETGDAAGALALFQTVLADRERVLGKDHPDTQKTRENIAVLQSRGDPLVPKLQLGNAVLEAPASGFQSSWSMKGKVSQAGTWEPVLPADVTHNAGES